MALTYRTLDIGIRNLMIEEIELDISLGKLYEGKRLTIIGLQGWPLALRGACGSGSDITLQTWLSQNGNLEVFEAYTLKGVTRSRRVPVSAAQTFAEGEFNRFYIRAICRHALNIAEKGQGNGRVTAYRARYSENPRPESVAIDGREFDAKSILLDLRENTSVDGINTALGLPAGPNSGMSVYH